MASRLLAGGRDPSVFVGGGSGFGSGVRSAGSATTSSLGDRFFGSNLFSRPTIVPSRSMFSSMYVPSSTVYVDSTPSVSYFPSTSYGISRPWAIGLPVGLLLLILTIAAIVLIVLL